MEGIVRDTLGDQWLMPLRRLGAETIDDLRTLWVQDFLGIGMARVEVRRLQAALEPVD